MVSLGNNKLIARKTTAIWFLKHKISGCGLVPWITKSLIGVEMGEFTENYNVQIQYIYVEFF